MRNTILLFTVICIALVANADLYAQDYENVEQVGRIFNYWGKAKAVALSDNYAFTATEYSGLQVVDISDLEDIHVIGFYDYITDQPDDIILEGNYAYISARNSMTIINISDPEQPNEICFFAIEERIFDFTVEDNYIYLACGADGLQIIDISDPENLQYVCTYETIPLTVQVYNRFAYVTAWTGQDYDFELQIIDISEIDDLREVGHTSISGSGNDLAVDNNLAYISVPDGLQILSVENPENPRSVSSLRTRQCEEFVIFNEYAYMIDRGGLRVIDIEDAENPHEVGEFEMSSWDRFDIVVEDYFAYIADGDGGLRIIDVQYPDRMRERGFYESRNSISHVAVEDNYVYVTANNDGLFIVNATDPTRPYTVGHYITQGARNVSISGDYAYVAKGDLGIIDISDPNEPRLIGSYDGNGIRAVRVSGIYAYILDGSLKVLNIGNPRSPSELGSTAGTHAYELVIMENTAYVAALDSGLFVIDVEDPLNPHEIGYFDTPGNAQDIDIEGNYVYIADHGQGGLQIIDVSLRYRPQRVGVFDTPGSEFGVSVYGDYAFVAGGDKGLRVINVSDPTNPSEVGFFDTPGYARDVQFLDGLLYVADQTNLGIYRFTDPAKVDDDAVSLPVEFNLFTAYPNPFNSTISINYSLDRNGFITLKLYDLSGREVASLVNKRQSAGYYSTIWNAEGLPSGVYLLRLNAGVHERGQKLVLMK
ncbi:T9SS type A sorting domain-containing protein [bacterium]|nr:T9SS type A sorting domain-containing protein [bacterium]